MPAATNKKLKLLWVGIGKDDKLVMAGNNALKRSLTKGGIKHTYRETEGRHEWVVWRHHLREVAPLLFKLRARESGVAGSTLTAFFSCFAGPHPRDRWRPTPTPLPAFARRR